MYESWLPNNKNILENSLKIHKSVGDAVDCQQHKWTAIAKLSPSKLANPQLGAEIALLSQLWGTTIHHTPYDTRNSSFACLKPYYNNYGDLFMTR